MPVQKEVSKKSVDNKSEVPTPTGNATPKSKKKVEYKYAGGGGNTVPDSFKAILKRLAPTDRMAVILGFIFLAVIILALFQFPFNKLISGDMNVEVKAGYPWPFLKLGLIDPSSPLQLKELFLDLIVYIILAYIIDMFIKIISKTKLIKSKEDLKKQPAIFKAQKATIADKITKKVFKEELPVPEPENQPNSPEQTIEQSPSPKTM
ncbi:hypothetical protein K8R30_01845 [archaeon]|nr:hypothetical protein [archaeon]